MNVPFLTDEPLPVFAFRLLAHLGIGFVAGEIFFRLLRRQAQLLITGGPVLAGLGLLIVRIILLVAVLGLVSREGALPLIATAAGIMLGRIRVLRPAKGGDP
jgi:hypothetical protein